MKNIFTAIALVLGLASAAFADPNAPSLPIIGNVITGNIEVSSTALRSVRVGLQNSKPSVLFNEPGFAPVILAGESGLATINGTAVATSADIDLKVAKAGDTMTGHLTASGGVTASSLTVQGNAFSVGGSTLAVSNGKVGIGQAASAVVATDPYNLSLGGGYGNSAVGKNLKLKLMDYGISAGDFGLGVSANLFELTAANDGEFAFFKNATATPTELVRIKNNGNVGIGTTAPTHTLQVNGSIGAVGIDASSMTLTAIPTSAGAGGLYVCIDTAGVMYKKSSCP